MKIYKIITFSEGAGYVPNNENKIQNIQINIKNCGPRRTQSFQCIEFGSLKLRGRILGNNQKIPKFQFTSSVPY